MKSIASALFLLSMLAVSPALRAEDSSVGQLRGPEGARADEEEVQRMFQQSVALGIPEAELADLVKGCRGAGFSSGELRRVLSLMAKAKLAGLPHDDLLNKLREGLAKGVSPEPIEKALDAKAQVLRRAKSLVDTLLTEGRVAPNYGLAVKVVADALEAGAPAPEVLRAVREGRPPAAGMPDVRTPFRELPAKK